MRFPDYPQLSALTDAIIEVWPEHKVFIARRFRDCETEHLKLSDTLAGIILKLSGDNTPRFCQDYRFTCDLLLQEELHFRRSGKYRYTTFAEAEEHVYAKSELMVPYINGLLLSQVIWGNHTRTMGFFVDRFLPKSNPDHRLLEIGPGHGLSLYFAASRPGRGEIEAWDVSEASVAATAHALTVLGIKANITLKQCDLFTANTIGAVFHDVILSEVLEHLEAPKEALVRLREIMKPGGRIFINVPCNSPAPDHIYLFETPEAIFNLITEAGFELQETAIFPATGYSEERARKAKITISCAAIAKVPD